ncbi:MAG TPA: cellulose synthase [Streptosporangiaceae bacterium]|nr:cellulose synthase [Streptosporangiaceae bacterium]
MSTYNSISWLPLAGGLTILGLILSWVAWRRRGAAAGLRGVAWSLLPLAAYLTGAIKMLWQMGSAIGTFASSFVFSPRVWAGVIVAGAAGVLFAVSAGLRRARKSRSGGRDQSARAAKPGQAAKPGSPAQPAQPGKALKPATKKNSGLDDDLGDAAEVLKRMGIR